MNGHRSPAGFAMGRGVGAGAVRGSSSPAKNLESQSGKHISRLEVDESTCSIYGSVGFLNIA